MLKAILFDSDGVLVDTERLFFEATRDAFQAEGVGLSPAQWARWFLSEGKRSSEIAQLLGMPSGRIEKTIENRFERFWRRIDQGVAVNPGIVETLNQLAPSFRLAIVTGATKSHFDRVHQTTGLLHYFETVVTYDDCEHVKPHPQAYLIALQRLGLQAEECVAIEDSPRGATAALAAGIRCFLLPTSLTDLTLCPPGCVNLEHITHLPRHLR
jgi:HAD superfamily hydrolase (TIGR01509 family)